MDFSEYTLVSLGDSFTFGQDIIPDPIQRPTETTQMFNKRWKDGCNKRSFTARVTKSLGFKYSINFGIMGGCNQNSIELLDTFLRRNPGMKIFVLFNFTSSSRMMNFFQLPGQKVYHKRNVVPHHAVEVDTLKDYGISSKDVADYYTLWNNSIQEVYNHIENRRSVLNLLTAYNVPYISFDIANGMDYQINRDNPLRYVGPKHQYSIDGHFFDDLYDDDRFNFPEFDYVKSYIDNVINEVPPLSNHITMRDMYGSRNLIEWLALKGIDDANDKDHYYAKYGKGTGSHWTSQGHVMITELMVKKINERYN